MADPIRLDERLTLKAGVIGCGDWGKNHIRTLKSLGVLAAVADANPERAAAFAAEFGVAGLTPEEMIASPDIQAVVLALPADRHVETALKVMDAGKHVLVEKPMALEIDGAEAIVATAERTGVVAMTGHVLRFHPAFEALEKTVESGALGRVKYVYSTRIGLGKFFSQTDALWDIAPHDLSLLFAITKELPETTHLEGVAMITDAPDFAHLHMAFPSGARSHTFISRLAPHRDRKFTVIGDKAMAVFDDLQDPGKKLAIYNHRIWQEGEAIKFESAEAEYVETSEKLPLTSELEHFLHCAQHGLVPKASVREGLDVLRVLAGVAPQRERLAPSIRSFVQAGE
ncbi:Gfo/Idh/MocA family protein [Anianabacter salinae]|uniref:Gfo/Idh/MocA family protein n=1 Tax=Anianabacter salinae TaxID=2851023 RepID=UPI00225DDE3E|nr:Gfo/Idh/MocA family oxidoreductase [Anianabacter salinae]MBV0912355.1 Gfo/Idh/MocA family oxidoreductase [Anianabacter salinae]